MATKQGDHYGSNRCDSYNGRFVFYIKKVLKENDMKRSGKR